MLAKERRKLKDVESGTLVEYIKTSIEILMNMRLEEYQMMQAQKNERKKKPTTSNPNTNAGGKKDQNEDNKP